MKYKKIRIEISLLSHILSWFDTSLFDLTLSSEKDMIQRKSIFFRTTKNLFWALLQDELTSKRQVGVWFLPLITAPLNLPFIWRNIKCCILYKIWQVTWKKPSMEIQVFFLRKTVKFFGTSWFMNYKNTQISF